jgi:hypothetical protein
MNDDFGYISINLRSKETRVFFPWKLLIIFIKQFNIFNLTLVFY